MVQVVGTAGDQIPGFIFLVKKVIHRQKLTEQILPQFKLDLAGNPDDQFPHQEEANRHKGGEEENVENTAADNRTAILAADFIQDNPYVLGDFHVTEILHQHEKKSQHQDA
jgi:hypothetical protein